MIRLATKADLSALERVAAGTEMFIGEELRHFTDSMGEHLSEAEKGGEASYTLLVATDAETEDSSVVGAAYFGPATMAQGVMNLLFMGVLPDARRGGRGAALLAAFENAVLASNARLAIIETASDDMFMPAWALYRSRGYDEEARVRDYYDDGLDKLVFRKRITR